MKVNKILIKEDSVTKFAKEVPKRGYHLCWDCLNGYPNRCTKVADYQKKSIDDYPYITDGYQFLARDQDNNLAVKKFIVEGCENFQDDLEVKRKRKHYSSNTFVN